MIIETKTPLLGTKVSSPQVPEEAAPFLEAVEVQHNHTWASPRRLYFNE